MRESLVSLIGKHKLIVQLVLPVSTACSAHFCMPICVPTLACLGVSARDFAARPRPILWLACPLLYIGMKTRLEKHVPLPGQCV
jgi:hypothetical protein